jgi:hypothetical protein
MFKFRDHWTPAELKIKDEIADLRYTFRNGGINSDGCKTSIQDAISTPSSPLTFKRVISEVVQEAVEPNLIGTSLLSRIDYDGYGSTITFGTMGAVGGIQLDMAEGQEYPEFGIQTGNGTVTANIGKSGLALKVTEEMIKYSQWDIIGLHLRQAGYAMARNKERKIFDLINRLGVVVFDNSNPANSEIGRTSGRDLTGAGNGSMTVDDLFDMYAKTLERGFTPNVCLVHPLAWATFLKDPVLREFALQSGGTQGAWFNGLPTNVSPNTPDVWKSLGKMQGPTAMDPSPAERAPTQQSTMTMPGLFPFGGLRIIPSPNVPFDTVNKTTSIIMMDTSNLGAIVVAEDPMSEQWDDPARDVMKIKIRERYGMVLFNEGLAVSVAKNVSVDPNEIVLPPQATVSGIAPIVRK